MKKISRKVKSVECLLSNGDGINPAEVVDSYSMSILSMNRRNE